MATVSTTASPYGTNYFGFGTKDAYAKAINDKLYGGSTLSNPTAAHQFMSENPEYFNNAWTRDYLTNKGIQDIGFNSITGMVTIGGQDAFRPDYITGGKSYASPTTIDSALSRLDIKSPYDIPSYTSPYADQITSGLSAITNRSPFNYDPNSDKGLQSAMSSTTDAISRAAARRGMIYSDSNKAQMGQAAMGLIPQFRNEAYSEYSGENNRLNDVLAQLMALENAKYGQFRDTIGDNRYVDTTRYDRSRNAFSDSLTAQELAANINNANRNYGLQRDQLAWQKENGATDNALALAQLQQGTELTPYQRAQIDNMNFDNGLALQKRNDLLNKIQNDPTKSAAYNIYMSNAVKNMFAAKDPYNWLKDRAKDLITYLGSEGYKKLQLLLSNSEPHDDTY